jgi:hypothetical protein
MGRDRFIHFKISQFINQKQNYITLQQTLNMDFTNQKTY